MKQSILVKFCVLSALLSAASTFAGGFSDGGGNAIVCFNDPSIPAQIREKDHGQLLDKYIPNITSIEAFDLYEAKLPRGSESAIRPTIVPMKEGERRVEYFARIHDRLRQLVPQLADSIGESFEGFYGNIIREPHGLERIDDVNSVALIDRERCVLATMAVQTKLGDQDALHLDQRLFDHPLHSELSKAVLLVHEYVYRYARTLGHTDSSRTRALVGLMITQNPKLTVKDFMSRVYKLGFLPKVDPDKLSFSTGAGEAYESTTQVILNNLLTKFAATSSKEASLLMAVRSLINDFEPTRGCPEAKVELQMKGWKSSVTLPLWESCREMLVDPSYLGTIKINGKTFTLNPEQQAKAADLEKQLEEMIKAKAEEVKKSVQADYIATYHCGNDNKELCGLRLNLTKQSLFSSSMTEVDESVQKLISSLVQTISADYQPPVWDVAPSAPNQGWTDALMREILFEAMPSSFMTKPVPAVSDQVNPGYDLSQWD